MLLHGREIAIVVQQSAMTFDAERADDDVRGLADRDAEIPSQSSRAASGGHLVAVLVANRLAQELLLGAPTRGDDLQLGDFDADSRARRYRATGLFRTLKS